MSEPIMKKVKGDGVEINLAVWEGTGKPILCVHGITANCRCWDVLANALTPGYRILANSLTSIKRIAHTFGLPPDAGAMDLSLIHI